VALKELQGLEDQSGGNDCRKSNAHEKQKNVRLRQVKKKSDSLEGLAKHSSGTHCGAGGPERRRPVAGEAEGAKGFLGARALSFNEIHTDQDLEMRLWMKMAAGEILKKKSSGTYHD